MRKYLDMTNQKFLYEINDFAVIKLIKLPFLHFQLSLGSILTGIIMMNYYSEIFSLSTVKS